MIINMKSGLRVLLSVLCLSAGTSTSNAADQVALEEIVITAQRAKKTRILQRCGGWKLSAWPTSALVRRVN